MKCLFIVTCLGLFGSSFAANCEQGQIKQELERKNIDPVGFYLLKGFKGVEIEDVQKAVVGLGGIELDLGQCLIVKPKTPSQFVKVCAEVKKTKAVNFFYKKGGEWHEPSNDAIGILDDGTEFARSCWVLRNDKPKLPKNVTQVRICPVQSAAIDEPIKMKNVEVVMCQDV